MGIHCVYITFKRQKTIGGWPQIRPLSTCVSVHFNQDTDLRFNIKSGNGKHILPDYSFGFTSLPICRLATYSKSVYVAW